MSDATPSTKMPAPASGEETTTRPPAAKPQLLDQLPVSIFATPGFLAGVLAMELLYGLVLFAFVSSIKRDRLIAWGPEPPPEIARVETFVPQLVKPSPAKESAKTSGEKARSDAAADKDKKGDTADAKKDASGDADKPAAKKPAKNKRQKKKTAAGKKKTEVALKNVPAEPPPPPKEIPTIPPLGMLIDPTHKSDAQIEDGTLVLKVPRGIYIFDRSRNIETAPRAVTTVEGDFVAEVNVAGEVRAPVINLAAAPKKGTPAAPAVSFRGAGLLLWQDSNNYIRFERVSFYAGTSQHKIMFESCTNGKQGKNELRGLKEGTVRLKVERKGSNFTYSYTTDGKTWLKLLNSAVKFPPTLNVGISASNASSKAFSARFEDFVVKSSAKAG